MNQNNYGTLPACQRLVAAGIVIETDLLWRWYNPDTLIALRDARKVIPSPYLILREPDHAFGEFECPAPSMVEMWRELPYGSMIEKLPSGFSKVSLFAEPVANYRGENPTDALIDLLIWIRKEAK